MTYPLKKPAVLGRLVFFCLKWVGHAMHENQLFCRCIYRSHAPAWECSQRRSSVELVCSHISV